MILTIDRTAKLSNLMVAYKLGDLSRYLRILESCKSWLDEALYTFYYNLSIRSIFTRKGYFK